MLHDGKNPEAELRDAERILDQRRGRVRRERRIADVISRLLARKGYAQVEASLQLGELWSNAVGAPVSSHSRPAGLKRGVLEVSVRNSVTLQELTIRKRELLAKLHEQELGRAIRDLRFRVASFD